MPYDLNLKLKRARIADRRLDCVRASKAIDSGGWDFISGSAVGPMVEFDNNELRSTPAGSLGEETTTNEIRNSRCENSINGPLDTTGVLPTNWGRTGGAAADMEVVGSGTEDDWPYVDVRWNVSGATTNFGIVFEPSTTISALANEDWTFASGMKLVGGSLANTTIKIRFRTYLAAAGKGVYDAGNWAPDAVHKRFAETVTFDAVTIDTTRPELLLDFTGAADVTLRIYAPQKEEKAYPTGLVLPEVGSPAAATRASETISLPSGPHQGSVSTTIFMDVYFNNIIAGTRRLFSLGNTTNGVDIFYRNANFNARAWSGGVAVASMASSVPAANTPVKIAFAIAEDNYAFSQNGASQVVDSAGDVPIAMDEDVFYFGAGAGSTVQGSLYFKDIVIKPVRVSNAEMEAWVGN